MMFQRTTLFLFIIKPVFLNFILLSCALITFSQPVSYPSSLDSVKDYIEKNYVGFADKVNAQTQNAYQQHTALSYQYAKRAKSTADYYFIIRHWLTFFKDRHLSINPAVDTTHIVEKVQLDDKQIQKLYHAGAGSVEGIYYSSDSVYKVAVIKSKKGLRSYAGIILSSKTVKWKAGQVKFELFETDAHQYTGVWYNRLHNMFLAPIQFNAQKGLSDEGWYKHGAAMKIETATTPLFDEEKKVNTFFKTLNDSTCYLRIKSFDGSYAREIDSVIKANVKTIQSTAKLIIDLRGNGGGSDHCMSFLQPVLYTNPVQNIGVDLLTTPDNTIAWELIIGQYRDKLPKAYLDEALKKIHLGDGKARAFVNFASDYTGTLPAVWANPARVAVVIDGRCASATEEFLLLARQSSKTKMAGERSSGVLDYSNVVHRDFSSPPFTLNYPTTRSRRIDAGLGIDNKGIQPDIPLNLSSNNWLDELMKQW
jgi:hypothetical protein